MKKEHKEALLQYLEFHLISMVEHVEEDINGLAKAKLYNHGHEVLADLRDAIESWDESVDSIA